MNKNKRISIVIIALGIVLIIIGGFLLYDKKINIQKEEEGKKEIMDAIKTYIFSLRTDVNNMEYVFTATNTIYAVPIECIENILDIDNPFGKWKPSTEEYWAYVLVQYDDETYSYTYGFTFKDSAGYGLYPTTSEKLKENGSQIKKGLVLDKPTNNQRIFSNSSLLKDWKEKNNDNDLSYTFVVLTAAENGRSSNICTIKK